MISRITIFLALLTMATIGAFGKTVSVSSQCETPKGTKNLVCAYTVAFLDLEVDSALTIGLQIPKAVNTWTADRDLGCTGGGCVVAPPKIVPRASHLDYIFTVKKISGEIKFSVSGPASDYEAKSKPYYVTIKGEPFKPNGSDKLEVPYKKSKTSLIRPVIGGGFTRLRDDFVDFKEVGDDDTAIFTDNDSKWRAEALGGALFKVAEFDKRKWIKTLDIALNLEFAQGGQSVLDGIFVGVGYGITSAIEFTAGYSLGKGKELSFGFQRAMGRFIEDNRGNKLYENIQLNQDGVIEDIKEYDGLPLVDGNGTRIFPGNPINTSFNSKFSFGFLIPLDVWKQFKKGQGK